jgi:hypothetical protein
VTKLRTGSIIKVHGWVMLQHLDDGRLYRVKSTPRVHGKPVYLFTRPHSHKTVVSHYAAAVDLWITNGPNMNRIEIISHRNS